MEKNFVPWIEKYRPTELKTIAFDPINKKFFDNILKINYFPNLLIYGPPGTGKTTRINPDTYGTDTDQVYVVPQDKGAQFTYDGDKISYNSQGKYYSLRDPKNPNVMHALGTSITYSRRYALGAIYGIGSEEDEDAMSLNDQPNQKQSSTINRSPQRGANARQAKPSPVAHEMVTGKVAQASIPQSQKDALAKELKTLPPHGRNRVISSFRQEYNISSEKISEFITTPEHLSFIKSKIAEVESDSP